MSQPDTKSRILDAAEQLFARHGFHNTSIRAITSEAGVNLASANYHFGSKDALLLAVFERRLLPLNRERSERLLKILEQAEQAGVLPAVRDLMRAFIEPTLSFRNQGPGTRAFVSLIGRSMAEMDSTIRDCFIPLIEPLFKLLFSSLQRALPALPPAILLTRLQFAMGAMGRTMCAPDQRPLQVDVEPSPADSAAVAEALIGFVCAGLEAPC
ncbi:MAG: TetR/AcrR family transcriptional regulator [Desulfuromonadales bacterium]|nr:TetR/AcrR family transcriptional regulator [Desulfuromonadales bacterium]